MPDEDYLADLTSPCMSGPPIIASWRMSERRLLLRQTTVLLWRFMPDSVGGVRELRLVVTAPDYDDALRFYRDVLGLRQLAVFPSPGGRVTLLEAGRATLELTDPVHADFIDEVEVGQRVAGHVRVAFEVEDAVAATAAVASAGASVLAEPVRTPWNSLNARLEAPAGLQLTLFQELD